MKKYVLFFAVIMLVILAGCKTRSINKSQGLQEVTEPFVKESVNTKDAYRARASGQSPNPDFARRIAVNVARGELAGKIQLVVQSAMNTYTGQRQIANRTEYNQRAQDETKTITDRMLSNTDIIDSKTFLDPETKVYTVYVLVEANREDAHKAIEQGFSSNDILNQDFEIEQFRKLNEAAFEDVRSQRNY